MTNNINFEEIFAGEPDTKEKAARMELRFRPLTKMRQHIEKIVKDRTVVITGDTSHPSIQSIINNLTKIDDAPKYEWRDKDYVQDELLRTLKHFIPSMPAFGEDTPSDEEFEQIFAGEKSYEVSQQFSYDAYKCYDCAKTINMTICGNTLHLKAKHKCEQNHTFTLEIDFPSGEVVFGDWPDRFSEARDNGLIHEDSKESINYLRGQRIRSDEYAAQGIFHQSVGNSCPTILYNEKTHAIQLGTKWDEETDDVVIPEGYADVGSICTDLWWTTMIDKSYYDAMMAKLPDERDQPFYEKEVETFKLKPGRYRFTCNALVGSDDNDNDDGVYARAEWIGEASGKVPTFDLIDSQDRLMTVDEYVIAHANKYPEYVHPDTIKFRVMDSIFNVLGNGIGSKGEFISHIKTKKNTKFVLKHEVDSSKQPEFKHPYPGFDTKYSIFVESKNLDFFPTDWLEGAKWFYEKSLEYFEAGAEDYHYAYPRKNHNIETTHKDFTDAFDRIKEKLKEGEDFFNRISKDYGTPYDGDLPKFLTIQWDNLKKKTIKNIKSLIKMIDTELDKRK